MSSAAIGWDMLVSQNEAELQVGRFRPVRRTLNLQGIITTMVLSAFLGKIRLSRVPAEFVF